MYIGGSAAPLPENEPSPVVRKKRQTTLHSKYVRKVNKQNFRYTLAVIGAAMVIFALGVLFLGTRASLQANEAAIASLQAQLSSLTAENDDEEMKLSANVDYKQIYQTATQDLGMTYPQSGQVVTYDAGDSEYVEKYGDIPSGK